MRFVEHAHLMSEVPSRSHGRIAGETKSAPPARRIREVAGGAIGKNQAGELLEVCRLPFTPLGKKPPDVAFAALYAK